MAISLRIPSKSQLETASSVLIGARKRSAGALSVESAENELFSVKNPLNSPVSRQKRVRKAFQHPYFAVYQDETSSPDSYSSDSYREFSPVYSAPKIGSVRPNIIVELPFQPKIH